MSRAEGLWKGPGRIAGLLPSAAIAHVGIWGTLPGSSGRIGRTIPGTDPCAHTHTHARARARWRTGAAFQAIRAVSLDSSSGDSHRGLRRPTERERLEVGSLSWVTLVGSRELGSLRGKSMDQEATVPRTRKAPSRDLHGAPEQNPREAAFLFTALPVGLIRVLQCVTRCEEHTARHVSRSASTRFSALSPAPVSIARRRGEC